MRKANKAAFTSRRYRELMQNNRFECYKHMDANPSEDVEICPHHHAFYEIIFVVEGDFFYEVEGRPYHLSHGDVILIDELQFHRGLINHSQSYERYALWIHPKYMQRLAKRFPKLDPQYCFLQLNSDNNNILHLDDASFSELSQDLSRLFLSFWSKTPSDEVLSESYFAIILTKLNQIVHRMQSGEEIPTISAGSMYHSEAPIEITSKALAAVYNQTHAVSSPDLLEQYAPDGYITPAAQSPLMTHPQFHSAATQGGGVISAVDIANSGISGHAEAEGEHINTGAASSITEGSATYARMGSYSLSNINDAVASHGDNAHKAPHLSQVMTVNNMLNRVESGNMSSLPGGAHTADSAYMSVSGHPNVNPSLASLPHEMPEQHRAALPGNIASTGKNGTCQPYGYGYRSRDNLSSALEALNYSYDDDGFLNGGVAATLSLVSFASSLGTNVHNPPLEDVSIFDVDPEMEDNYVLNKGGIPDDGSVYNDVYIDNINGANRARGNVDRHRYAHSPYSSMPRNAEDGPYTDHAHIGADRLINTGVGEKLSPNANGMYPSRPRYGGGASILSADNVTRAHGFGSTHHHSGNPHSIQGGPESYGNIRAHSRYDAQGAAHGEMMHHPNEMYPGYEEQQNADGQYHTMLMQGEGATPAPIREHGTSPIHDFEHEGFDEDDMHLDIKLSERLKLSALLKHINLHINENLSLDELAQRFNLSKFYLTRRFKELTGLSLHQFIVKKRLTRARYLISVGTDPYCAAVDAGFNNYSHFSRTFKAYFGQNPSTIPQANKLHEGDQGNAAPVTKVNETRPSPDHFNHD